MLYERKQKIELLYVGGEDVFCVVSNVLQEEKAATVNMLSPGKAECNHVAKPLVIFERQGVTWVSEHSVTLEAGIQTINPNSSSHSPAHAAAKLHTP